MTQGAIAESGVEEVTKKMAVGLRAMEAAKVIERLVTYRGLIK